MPSLRRLIGRPQLPEGVRAVPLEPGERRLGWGVTTRGDAVLATTLGLRLPGAERLDWADVERATWRRPVMVVVKVSAVDGSGPRWQLDLETEHDLADAVRAQVTASVGWSDHVKLQPAGGVRLVGRRRPGHELLDWQMVFDAGTDPDDPQLRTQAEAVLLDVRRRIG